MRKPLFLSCVLIALLALTVKYCYLQERRALPDFARPSLDSKYHDDWAWGLASSTWDSSIEPTRDEPYFRAPLYAYFLSIVYRVFGRDYYIVRLIQILVGSLSAVLLFIIARALFDALTGWIAAAIYLAYWPITYFEAELLIPVLAIFLDLSLIALLLWASRGSALHRWLLTGIVFGLSAIARPNILVVLVPITVWMWNNARLGRAYTARKALALLLCGVAIPIIPVTVRNAVRGHDVVLISSQGGVNFYIGNNPRSNGTRAVVPDTRADWWGGYDDTKRIAEDAAGKPLRPSQVSNYWLVRGFEFIYQDPVAALRLYFRKLALLFGSGEISNNKQLYFARHNSRVLQLLIVPFSLILAFSVVGILQLIAARRKRKGVEKTAADIKGVILPFVILSYALSILFFFITSRYRLPIAVLLIPYAAHGARVLVEQFRSPQRRGFRRSLGTFLVVLFFSSLNPFKVGAYAFPRGYYALGVDYSYTDHERALDAFTKSLSFESTYAPTWKMRGWVYNSLGQYDRALVDLRIACALDSTFVNAYYSLGVVLQKQGSHREAGEAYRHVLRMDASNKRALNNLADVCLREGRFEEAQPLLEQALLLDPQFDIAIYGLGYCNELAGKIDRAIELYRKVLHTPAGRLGLARLYLKTGQREQLRTLLKDLRHRYSDSPDIEKISALVRAQEGVLEGE